MTARVSFRVADTRRSIRAAIQALRAEGLSPADFQIVHKDGETRILPAGGSAGFDEAADLERRMKDAFGV